jgi:hypothetical protein
MTRFVACREGEYPIPPSLVLVNATDVVSVYLEETEGSYGKFLGEAKFSGGLRNGVRNALRVADLKLSRKDIVPKTMSYRVVV